MRSFAIVLFFVALGAAGACSSVTVQPSNVSFKQALAACEPGTLGAITLSLGHVRITERPGVASDIDDANPNAQTVGLASQAGSATVVVNASKNTVSGKHITLASRNRVACIWPD